VAAEPAAASPEQVRAIVDDLRAVRDATQEEFRRVAERLEDVRRRIDDAASPAAEPPGPPSPEEEDRWTSLARDPDGGRRFSALQRLGRFRTERSVEVSIERLSDEDPKVVWQAVRNLGRFRAREAAAAVAALLDASVEIRAAAYETLLEMGAPQDTGYDATALPEQRREPAAALRRWADAEDR
jgi:HEAT repeat protein